MCSLVLWKMRPARTVPSLFRLAEVRTVSSYRPQKTHYDTLGLKSSASSKEIRHAFLKLSKQCHPDANKDPNNHKKFVQVNEAYSVLSKPTSRRDYDALMYSTYNATATNSHTSPYGYRSEPYTHHAHYNRYKGSYYEETDSNKTQHRSKEFIFYSLTLSITFAVASLLIYYMNNYMPSTKFLKLSNSMKSHEIEQHDFIMSSVHDGMTVYYYAVPNASDPESFEVLAVKRNQKQVYSETIHIDVEGTTDNDKHEDRRKNKSKD